MSSAPLLQAAPGMYHSIEITSFQLVILQSF